MASTTTPTPTTPTTIQPPLAQAMLQPSQASTQKTVVVNDDPDKLLSEWLGELENLIGGLEIPNTTPLPRLRPYSQTSSERTSSYRFSMANLEETHEAELDAILGELSLLEQHGTDVCNDTNGSTIAANNIGRHCRTHSRSNSIISGVTNSTISTSSESGNGSGSEAGSMPTGPIQMREQRTDSPDNDSAFSDTVSLMSSESSASSGVSSSVNNAKNLIPSNSNLLHCDSAKAAKIHLALQKLEQASVRRLFVKAFTNDGASKSLLVDERMTCGHVTRLLADKNHVQMEPHWALMEHLPELQMERLFEDHELLVDNLMNWRSDSKNRVVFTQREDKVILFNSPERYLTGTQMAPGSEHDDHTRTMLLDEFFASGGTPAMEGPLYVKIDSKKVWKRYHFVLRASGIYYYPKEKTKSSRDLLCHGLFDGHDVYKGIGWKKKHKAPTEYTFALKSQKETSTGTSALKAAQRAIKMLCADDVETLEKWIVAIRLAKYGKKILDNHRALIEELAREELDKFSSNRSSSVGSIVSSVPSQCSNSSAGSNSSNGSCGNNNNNNLVVPINGRLSRASSSSSSGCLSDENNAFDSDFPTGTIKRKPSMKPNLPLTSMTRQLKEVGETTFGTDSNPTSPERGGTLTRRHSRRRSEESGGSNNSTLKRRPANTRGSIESMNSSNSTPTPTPSSPGTPIGLSSHQPNILLCNNIVNNINNNINNNNNNLDPLSPLESMPSCMTDSTFSLPPPPEDNDILSASTLSLDSLPPPPPASELINDLSSSQLSLISLPPPPAEIHPVYISVASRMSPGDAIHPITHCLVPQSTAFINNINNNNDMPPNGIDECDRKEVASALSPPHPIYGKSIKPSIKAPPYKAPPPYNTGFNIPNGVNGVNVVNGVNGVNGVNVSASMPSPTVPPKTVTFADSPVLLRRKVCFEDELVRQQPLSPRRSSSLAKDAVAPPPPPRAEATRLSTHQPIPPKRLTDSSSNPPRDFLKDLQRVMRKKWQVAQKCKLEPATTPHEVLGFRDFTAAGVPCVDLRDSTPFYRDGSNVSNWVQEHYGGIAVDSLYENLGADMGVEPVNLMMKKRPPPPPPKRSTTTQLTNRT